MAGRKVSERKLILFTVGLLIVAGLVRLANYRVGLVCFYLAFAPLVWHRVQFYLRHRDSLPRADRYRKITLIAMLVTMAMNLLGLQDVEFFLLFMLAIDYLIVTNTKSTTPQNG